MVSSRTLLTNPFSARTKFGSGEDKAKRVMPDLSVWVNMLDYSAAILPVTTVDKNIDVVDSGYVPINGVDEKVFEACRYLNIDHGYNTLTIVDDPELYDGAHVAVQIVGRRFQEEKVLALTEILGDSLGKHIV